MLKRKHLFLLTLVVLLFSACSEYQKILKSPNPELKYEKSVEYYEEGEYLKALPLFEELIPLYRGTDKGQKIYFYYAYTNFHLDYLTSAAYHFRSYSSTYSLSSFAQEALFMSAYCNYLEAPGPTLDQTPTQLALEELQIFVNTYPKSELVDSANTLVDQLTLKLEEKKFLNAKQYYTIRKYKSAIVALNNVITEYPGTQFLEEIKLLTLKSYYYLATNSIKTKKKQRFDEGIEAYFDFIDNFADGKNINEAELVYAKLINERERFLIENPTNDEL
ncbi:MAG: outer membrane protein assembly factor BamD [Flavobacteriales bacterium]|nr:outer membrane protein assembly factor BamD [Flavobacteriales bacterium]